MPFFIVESLRPPRRNHMTPVLSSNALYHSFGFYGSDWTGTTSRLDRAGSIVGCSTVGYAAGPGVAGLVGAPGAPCRKRVGSSRIPLRRASKKRCGPVLHPVLPILATIWPLATWWPIVTRIAERWE